MNKRKPYRGSLAPIASRLALAATLLILLLAVACERPQNDPVKDPLPPTQEKPTLYTIKGSISLEDGTDPTGAMIFCAGTSFVAFADSKGQYAISAVPPGKYNLAAQKPNYQTTSLGQVFLEAQPLTGDNPTIKVSSERLPLAAGPQISALTAARGNLGILTGLARPIDGDASPRQILIRLGQTSQTTHPDEQGIFNLENIPPGRYDIHFELAGYDQITLPGYTIDPGENKLYSAVDLYPTSAALSGDSLSIMGEILFMRSDGTVAETGPQAAIQILENQRSAMASTNGEFLFDALAPGQYTLIAAAEGYTLKNEVKVNLTNELATAILVLREEKGEMTGIVELEGAKSKNLAGTQVSLMGTAQTALTDSKGRFRFPGIATGLYTLLASRADYNPAEVPELEIKASETLDIGALTLTRDVELPRVLSITPENGVSDYMILPTNIALVRFSKPMDIATIRQALSITPPCTHTIRRSASVSPIDAKTDLFEILITNAKSSNPLKFNTNYTIAVTQNARDTDANPLEAPAASRFRTGGLMIIKSFPPQGVQDLDIQNRVDLTAFFNGVIKESTLTDRSIKIDPRPNGQSTFRNIHTDPTTGWSILSIPITLAYDKGYTVRFESSIRTTDGVALSPAPFRLQFQTLPQPELRF